MGLLGYSVVLNFLNTDYFLLEVITGAAPGRDPTPKGGGGGGHSLRTPKMSYGTMCVVGAGGAGDFVLGIGQGEILLFDPMCLYSKYSKFRREFKNG